MSRLSDIRSISILTCVSVFQIENQYPTLIAREQPTPRLSSLRVKSLIQIMAQVVIMTLKRKKFALLRKVVNTINRLPLHFITGAIESGTSWMINEIIIQII